jgi:hypothetical protein
LKNSVIKNLVIKDFLLKIIIEMKELTTKKEEFNLLIDRYGPFIEEFQMYDSQGEPLFETFIRRVIKDPDFRIDNMEWINKVSYNFEWAYDLLESQVDDRYYHPLYTKEHIEYMIIIKDMLDCKI